MLEQGMTPRDERQAHGVHPLGMRAWARVLENEEESMRRRWRS